MSEDRETPDNVIPMDKPRDSKKEQKTLKLNWTDILTGVITEIITGAIGRTVGAIVCANGMAYLATNPKTDL